MFLKQRQISGRYYTVLLNGISYAGGASFAEITHFAPCFPKIKVSLEVKTLVTAKVTQPLLETVSGRRKLGAVTKIGVRSAICCESTGHTVAEL